MFWKTASQVERQTLEHKGRRRLSFQLGLPFGIFLVAVITLLLAATYLVQDRSSVAAKILPQAHADSVAFRVEQAIEQSASVASLIARLSSQTVNGKNLELIHALIDSDPALLSVSYMDTNLHMVWEIHSPATPFAENMQMTFLPSAMHFEQVETSKNGTKLETVHFPVYGSTGAQDGALAAVYDISVYWEILADYKDGDAYIVNSKGDVLLSRRTDGVNLAAVSASLGVRNFIGRNGVVSEYTNGNGIAVLSAWAPIQMPGWAVIVEEPLAMMYDQLRAMYLFVGILIFIVLLLFVNEALTIKRKIFIPLDALSKTAGLIAKGNLTSWVDTEANNEFDAVGEAMNTMALNMRSLTQDLENRIVERTEHLKTKTEEAERLNAFMVNRELRMLEVKEENRKLTEEIAEVTNQEMVSSKVEEDEKKSNQ